MSTWSASTIKRGTLALFLVFLLPAFPDDVISFIAGLTPIPIRTLVLISLAGRLPGYVLLSLGGNGLAYDNMNPIVVIGGVVAVIVALAYWKREWLHEMIASGDVIGFLRRRWPLSRLMTAVFVVGLTLLAVALYFAATVEPLR